MSNLRNDQIDINHFLFQTVGAPRPGERFKHFRTGDLYEIVAVGIDEATHHPRVMYRSLDTGVVWDRLIAEFIELVRDENGMMVQRFYKS